MNTTIFDKIPIYQFYLTLVVALSAMLIGNLISNFMTWQIMNIGGRISGIAGIIMNCLWLLFFISFYKSTKGKPEDNQPKTDIDVIDIINKEINSIKGGNEQDGANIQENPSECPRTGDRDTTGTGSTPKRGESGNSGKGSKPEPNQ